MLTLRYIREILLEVTLVAAVVAYFTFIVLLFILAIDIVPRIYPYLMSIN